MKRLLSDRPDSTRPRWCAEKRRTGAAAVEFAVILPLLVILLAGTIDIGRFGYTMIAVANAARNGAEYGIQHPVDSYNLTNWYDAIRTSARDEMAGWRGFDSTKISVTSSYVSSSTDPRVVVSVTYPFSTQVRWGFFPSTTSISRTVVLPMIR